VTATDDTTRDFLAAELGCPVVHLNTAEGDKQLGEWVSIWDDLRQQAPVLFSDFGPAGGYFMVTRREEAMQVLQDAKTWSSRAVTVMDPDPAYLWIPEMLDPPEHTHWRQQLGPFFAPKQIGRLEDKVRARAIELIDGIKDKGSCDFTTEFAELFPTTIFLELMGLPVEELDQFMEWEAGILHGDQSDPGFRAVMEKSMGEVIGYFTELVEKRRRDPKDDIVSHALTFDIGGRPPTQEELMAFCLLMFMAGLDTVTQNLNYAMYHLGTHPEDRDRLVADSSMIPTAVEEIIRAYAIVVASRKATKDTEIAGCPVKAGQMVAVSLASANRDENSLPDGTQIKIDRFPNNHIGFGSGPHRCLGSHLARREMTVALEEWHKRIPAYRVADGPAPVEHGGMYGVDSVKLVWDVADRPTDSQ
jgi:cytochrome P450